jgi:hypothetical protein
MTSSIAAVFVPLRSVRLFVLGTLAVCAAGVMWTACYQSKPSVSAECLKDRQYQFLAVSYCRAGEFEYAESALEESFALHSRAGCADCVSQVRDMSYLARVLGKQGRLGRLVEERYLAMVLNQQRRLHEVNAGYATVCRVHKNCEHAVDREECGLFGCRQFGYFLVYTLYPQTESRWVAMGRAGTDGSRVVSGHNELNDEFLQVVEEHDSRDRANEIR